MSLAAIRESKLSSHKIHINEMSVNNKKYTIYSNRRKRTNANSKASLLPTLTHRNLSRSKFRKCFFRYFQQWYELNRGRFALPLFICWRGQKEIKLGIGDIPSEKIHFSLGYRNHGLQEASLDYYWKGENIDYTVWMEASPKKTIAGVICRQCHEYGKDQRVFFSKRALWIDHFFEKILATVNQKIAVAERIEMLQSKDGCSYAKIFKPGEKAKKTKKSDFVVVDIVYPRRKNKR